MNPTQLGWRLATSRHQMRGGSVLDAFAIGAYSIATWLALTVGGGAWMLVQRAYSPTPAFTETLHQNIDRPPAGMFTEYTSLAFLAVALLVWPIISLGTSAALLGARGRAGSLASLRLLGATSTQVMRLSLVETVFQSTFGLLVGAALWLASLPAWQLVSFMTVPIGVGEMLMPAWLLATIAATLLLFAMVATFIAFAKVRVSPLGVSRRAPSKKLSWLRVAAFVLAFGAMVFISRDAASASSRVAVIISVMAMVMILVGGLFVVGPFVLQLVAWPMARTKSAARLLAARRILDDPRAAWRSVAALALLGLVAAFVSAQPANSLAFGGPRTPSYVMFNDIRTGTIITLVITFIVAVTATTMNQATSILDRADESRTQVRMGMPLSSFGKVRRRQVLTPVLVSVLGSMGLGTLLSVPLRQQSELGLYTSLASLILPLVLVCGVLLMLAATTALEPLQRAVLASQYRRND